MFRRALLLGIGALAVGGGWQYRDEIQTAVDENLGPPDTNTAIRTFDGDGFLNRLTLYESGAARLEFGPDYSCYERIAVGDTAYLRERNLRVWQLPQDGEMVVDMKSAVSGTRDPANEFWLDSLGASSQYCMGLNDVTTRFTVPQDWLE